MLNTPEPACLVIADISGYTSYLGGVELDHAQDILGDLMDTVVGALRPTFRLAKLEGDAAFVFVMTPTVDASQLMDTVERTYFAFRRRQRDIVRASTCECNACIRTPSLNLKVLAHHGLVGRQRIAGREELVGSQVILVHRLLKNDVTERLGFAAYALFTEACLEAMGRDPRALGLVEHRETYEVIGEVVGWVEDLEAAWQADLDRTRVRVDPATAMATLTFDLPAPPAVTWDFLTSPARRPQWQAGVSGVIEYPAETGRRGAGTTNHCIHGKDAVIEEVLDWRPFEYVTLRSLMPIPGAAKLTNSYELEPTATGTRVALSFERPRSARDRAFANSVWPTIEPMFRAGIEALGPLLRAEMQARAAAGDDDSGAPAPTGRHAPVDPTAVDPTAVDFGGRPFVIRIAGRPDLRFDRGGTRCATPCSSTPPNRVVPSPTT